MRIYADTSFLASLYLVGDVHHVRAIAALQGWAAPPELPLTPFGVIELENTFARLQYAGRLHAAEVRALMATVKADVGTGLLRSTPPHAYEWLEQGRDFVRRITPQTGTRTLDCLHLAMARIERATSFATFDANQRRAAAAAGFLVLPI